MVNIQALIDDTKCFETVRALIRHIERYLAEWNTHPTPFVWTKDPAAIIKKALRRGPGR